MEVGASEFLKQLIRDEVRTQLAAIRDSAKAYKPDQTCTVSWSGGHARAWPADAVRERAHEAIGGKLDPREIDELLLTVKFK